MARPSRLTDEVIGKYLSQGVWQPVTLSDHWDRNANWYPDRVAVTDGERRLSWTEAKVWTERLALALLELGLKRDDVLLVQLPNTIELPLLRVACERAGILCLPLPHTLRQAEMRLCANLTRAAAAVVPWKFRDFDYLTMIREVQRDSPNLRHIIVAGNDLPAQAVSLHELTARPWEKETDTATLEMRRYKSHEVSLINATTGSTGLPKFAEYTAAARLLYGHAYVETLGVTPEDAIAALSPAAAGPNIPVYFAAPQMGNKAVFLTHFEPDKALALIQKERVTVACVVPALLAMLVNSPASARYNLSSVRFWVSVGAPLAPNLAREAEGRLGGIVINTYGAVDWGGVVFTSPLDSPEVRYTTVGKPRVGTEVRLMEQHGRIVPFGSGEIGELQGRGPSCSTGYYGNAEESDKSWAADGWLPLGDLGRWDEKGNLTVLGRKDELIIRGAQNIQPFEIENHLLAHPKIKQVAVVGMPDPIMGQKVCAYVIPRTEDGITLAEVVSFLRLRQLAPYKLPERLELVKRLPMVSDTKVNKRILAADIAEKLRQGA